MVKLTKYNFQKKPKAYLILRFKRLFLIKKQMKKIILLLSVLVSLTMSSQDSKRVIVKGQIVVESSDIGGITVFNISSNSGTITNMKGEFDLQVGLNDLIEVSALQFKNIRFEVNEDIISSKSMRVILIEEVNKLDEVVVYSGGLTGNLNADMNDKKRFKPKLNVLYFGMKNQEEIEFQDGHRTKVENLAVNSRHFPMIHGLNVVNVVDQLLLPLFRSKVNNNKVAGVSRVPVESIKYYFGSEFLVENFDIPKHRVEEFIRYVEADNFDFNLLNYGKEMDFLETIYTKSLQFLDDK